MSSTIRAPPTPCHLQRSSQSRRDVRDFDFLSPPLTATKSGIGFLFFFRRHFSANYTREDYEGSICCRANIH